MTPQKNQLRFPRLRAALALTGVFALTNANADVPNCTSHWERFGQYSISVELHRSEGSSLPRFRVDLARFMPSDPDAYMLRSTYLDQREVMQEAVLRTELHYIASNDDRGDGEIQSHAATLRFPGEHNEEVNSKLSRATLHFNDTVLRPRAGPGLRVQTVNHFFQADSSIAIFEQWEHGGSVVIEFTQARDGEHVVIGSVELAPDAISEYYDLGNEKAEELLAKWNAGECKAHDIDCFLTTATVHCIGLEDDCWELQTLREFRDNFLLQNNQGRALVADYYDIAPAIVEAVNRRADSEWQWLKTYWTGILPTALLVKAGMHGSAQRLYQRVVHDLQAKIG